MTPISADLAVQFEKKRIAIIDLGAKRNILKNLAERDLDIFVFPANTAESEIPDLELDALLIVCT